MFLVEFCLVFRRVKLELVGSNIMFNGFDLDYMNLFIC